MQALRLVNGGDEQAVLRDVLKAKEHHRRVALSHEKPGPEWEVAATHVALLLYHDTHCDFSAVLPSLNESEFVDPQTVLFCIVCSSLLYSRRLLYAALRCIQGSLILNLLCGD